MTDDLIRLGALEARDLIRRGDVTSLDLVEAAARRIAAVEPVVNALPTLCLDRAREQAAAADRARRQGEATVLAGLPLAIKDNNDVGGVRSTGGTLLFKDRVAETSDRTVALIERNGGVVLGKSNLSELGGAQTTNRVLGTTRNPYDVRLTCGGSSGGAAVALATGEAWLAHGNDYGGSLRIPAAFCNVVGLRPTPGRVPRKRLADPFDTLAVEGPMARSVADLALFFDAMVGFDPGDLLTAPTAEPPFLEAALAPEKPARLAVSADLGVLPVAAPIRAAIDAFAGRMTAAGIAVHHGAPDVSEAMTAFRALRGAGFYGNWKPFLPAERDKFPDAVLADLDRGRDQAGAALAEAHRYRAELFRRTTDFLDEHRFLVCPAAQAMPFPVETLYPPEIEGVAATSYLDWIAITAIWSMPSLPAIAVPIGFSPEGLPIGVQILAHARQEAALFRLAAWIERELGLPARPIDPR